MSSLCPLAGGQILHLPPCTTFPIHIDKQGRQLGHVSISTPSCHMPKLLTSVALSARQLRDNTHFLVYFQFPGFALSYTPILSSDSDSTGNVTLNIVLNFCVRYNLIENRRKIEKIFTSFNKSFSDFIHISKKIKKNLKTLYPV